MGVDTGGAGDQGLMFGYASKQNRRTDAYAHCVSPQTHTPIGRGQKKNILPWVRPDGKSQVTVEYKMASRSGSTRLFFLLNTATPSHRKN